MFTIDLNCDMGEGMSNDAKIMPYISSVNIACGAHAGNKATMQRTIDLAQQYNVAIGAHPGFADKINFGRIAHQLTEDAYYQLIREQLLILQKHIDNAGAVLHHVKPHGALYNMSAKDYVLATIIVKAVKDHSKALILYGLSNSRSIVAAEQAGLQTASEVFADRSYTDNGDLTPRTDPRALITNTETCVQQVLQMIQHETVTSVNGKTIPVKAETVCIHGDGAHAASFAKLVCNALKQHLVLIKPL